jgi:hypothetical protein
VPVAVSASTAAIHCPRGRLRQKSVRSFHKARGPEGRRKKAMAGQDNASRARAPVLDRTAIAAMVRR